jgi:hypothetical protein
MTATQEILDLFAGVVDHIGADPLDAARHRAGWAPRVTALTPDVETIHTWARHGLPADEGTRAYEVTLLVRLLWEVAEMHDALDDLGAAA